MAFVHDFIYNTAPYNYGPYSQLCNVNGRQKGDMWEKVDKQLMYMNNIWVFIYATDTRGCPARLISL